MWGWLDSRIFTLINFSKNFTTGHSSIKKEVAMLTTHAFEQQNKEAAAAAILHSMYYVPSGHTDYSS
jgi:hypothetical protein